MGSSHHHHGLICADIVCARLRTAIAHTQTHTHMHTTARLREASQAQTKTTIVLAQEDGACLSTSRLLLDDQQPCPYPCHSPLRDSSIAATTFCNSGSYTAHKSKSSSNTNDSKSRQRCHYYPAADRR